MYQNANRPMKKMARPRPNYNNEFYLIINGKNEHTRTYGDDEFMSGVISRSSLI